MLRSAAGKVMWVGRATVFLVGLAVVLALLFGVASTALGANSEPFILGVKNVATALTKLVGNVSGGPALKVANTETDAGSKGLNITVAEGMQPIVVNATAGKATNLNADELDGQDSTDFAAAGSQVADSLHADSADSATNAQNAEQADTATNATNADLLDGLDSTKFSVYKSTVVVSPVGTDTENGTALLDALEGITDASPTNPYLLKIEPGTYDVSSGLDTNDIIGLEMEEYVDIEGSGELNTTITSDTTTECDWPGDEFFSTVEGANNAELRFLTVSNAEGFGECNVAITNRSASPRLTNVTVTASGFGHTVGVANLGSNPTMTNVTATAAGLSGASNGAYGVYNEESSPTIKQSTLIGSTSSLSQLDGGTAKVADTQLVGPVTGDSGTLQCFNNYDQDMAAVTCP